MPKHSAIARRFGSKAYGLQATASLARLLAKLGKRDASRESPCRRPRAAEERVRLFLFDRLADRVQDEQELIRRRDAAEHAHTTQNLEFPARHLVTY
jgi:hypothetical protein